MVLGGFQLLAERVVGGYALVSSKQPVQVAGVGPEQLIHVLVVDYLLLAVEALERLRSLQQQRVEPLAEANVVLHHAPLQKLQVLVEVLEQADVVPAQSRLSPLPRIEPEALEHLPNVLRDQH